VVNNYVKKKEKVLFQGSENQSELKYQRETTTIRLSYQKGGNNFRLNCHVNKGNHHF
jgi:hypothetical protein